MSHTQSSSKTAPKNISVYLRVRPPVPREKSHTFNNIVYNPRDPRSITVARKAGAGQSSKEFFFNRVFQPNSKQEEVYEAYAKNAVNAAFDGQHGVLFVYGQTGSGKTFTISNDDPKTLGVLQQAMREIWSKINTDKEHEYTCSVSYVQLYNEILTDLLDEQKGKVRIQLGSEGRGDVVLVAESNGKSIEHSVNDYESTMDMFRTGMTRKEMQSTSMNLTSSRSHTVFTFHIRRFTRVSAVVVNDGGADDGAGVCALEGRLVLCDLAGSERVSKTHAAGKTLDEATHINGSLLVLGKVVAALTEKHSQHAPFRESKLTRILQYSLLGNGNTSLVVNISPSDDNTEESLSAIGFGQRAIQIKQDAKRHEVLDYRALYLQLMAELDNKKDSALEGVLAEEKEMYEDRISALKERVQVLTTENTALEQEVRRLKSGAPALAGDSEGQVSSEWKDLARSLEGKIEALERKLATTSDQRFKVATKLSEEQLRTFKLAKLLRQTSMSYQVERGELTRKMDELGNELAGLKGTDYLSITGALQRDTMPAEDAASPREGSPNDASSPRDKNQDGMSTEEVENLRRELRGMREERAELIVYYWKATQAIRMLAAEKDELAHKLRRSKTSS